MDHPKRPLLDQDGDAKAMARAKVQKWLDQYRSVPHLDRKLEAADNLVRNIEPQLSRYIWTSCPHEDFDDILQDSLVSIGKALPGFKGGAPAFVGWCYRITSGQRADYYDSNRRRKVEVMDIDDLREMIDASEQTTPLSSEDMERLEDALQMVDEAKPPCRDLLIQRFVHSVSFKEIGRGIGKTAPAMRKQIGRCMKLVQELISRKGSAYA